MKIGFIGTGNMGGAILNAVAKVMEPGNIFISNRTQSKSEAIKERLKINVSTNEEILRECHYIFLGIKPYQIEEFLGSYKDIINARTDLPVIISMIAGKSISFIKEYVKCPIIRIMPNTPVAVCEGMTLYAYDDISDEEEKVFLELMSKSGEVLKIEEDLIDQGGAISGCGPAFCDLFMEALSDGGVAIGLKREDALLLAAQTLKGAGELYLKTKTHPGELKDNVTSPKGTTIQGVIALEERGFRASVINAVIRAYNKTQEL